MQISCFRHFWSFVSESCMGHIVKKVVGCLSLITGSLNKAKQKDITIFHHEHFTTIITSTRHTVSDKVVKFSLNLRNNMKNAWATPIALAVAVYDLMMSCTLVVHCSPLYSTQVKSPLPVEMTRGTRLHYTHISLLGDHVVLVL